MFFEGLPPRPTGTPLYFAVQNTGERGLKLSNLLSAVSRNITGCCVSNRGETEETTVAEERGWNIQGQSSLIID